MKAIEALSLVAGHVSAEILLRKEYLAAENEILRSKLGKRIDLSNLDRIRLAKLGKKLGRRTLEDVAAIVKPDTVLGWYRDLVAKKFDGSQNRKGRGRPRVDDEIETLVLRMAQSYLGIRSYGRCSGQSRAHGDRHDRGKHSEAIRYPAGAKS